jgi:hypothetical protein
VESEAVKNETTPSNAAVVSARLLALHNSLPVGCASAAALRGDGRGRA